MKRRDRPTKKQLIVELARELGAPKFTPAEIEQLRRQLVARLGPQGKASADSVTSVLRAAGMRVVLYPRADTEGRYEEEFSDLLHFATLEEAEMCLVRLDELLRRFRAHGERAAAERVLEVGRLGRRRAQMIARNPKVDPRKRAEKAEMVQWFTIWLETPDAFFDWLEIRRHAPEFVAKFGVAAGEES